MDVDGARFASVPVERIGELGLSEGLEIDEHLRDQLAHAADVEAAHKVAIRSLATRPRSVNGLLWKLREKGHDPKAAGEAVERLKSRGLLDDRGFALDFARTRLEKGHGPVRILRDLLAQRVERVTAERAINDVIEAEGVDPLVQARKLAEKRAERLGSSVGLEKKRWRVLSFLNRRGFRGHEIRDIVDEILGRVE